MRLLGLTIHRTAKVPCVPKVACSMGCEANTLDHFLKTLTIARDLGITLAMWKLYEFLSQTRPA